MTNYAAYEENTGIFNIFLTNLGKYNEGHLVGKWVQLPCEDLDSELEEIGINEEYEEWFITDYESPFFEDFKIDEYENIFELNELAEEISNFDSCEIDEIIALTETGCFRDIREAIEAHQSGDCIFYGCDTLEDLAEELVEEGCFGDIPESIRNYIDYAAIARDLSYDSYYETSKGIVYVG